LAGEEMSLDAAAIPCGFMAREMFNDEYRFRVLPPDTADVVELEITFPKHSPDVLKRYQNL